MHSRLRLRVGGLTLAVRSGSLTRLLDPPRTYRPFLVTRGADIQLELVEDLGPEIAAQPPLFDSGGVWSVHAGPRGGIVYAFRSPAADPPLYKAVSIDGRLTRGRLHVAPSRRRRPVFALDYPLDELLIHHRSAREGGLGLHACGVVRDGQALLFCGVSGSGKTTTARLWSRHARARVLSDDRIVVRQRGRGYWAYGTPWHGEGRFASALARPLAGVFFLRHGDRSRATPLSPGVAAALLLARSFPPAWDAAAMRRVLDTCARLAQAVPCYELSFVPDVSAIRAVLGRSG